MINISNSDIYYKPYPYMLFKDVFDANFYNLLCSEFPKTNELLKLDFDKKKNEYKQDNSLENCLTNNMLCHFLRNNIFFFSVWRSLQKRYCWFFSG